MKTEQEQIEKMARSMCGYCSTDGRCAVSKNGREPDICANVDTEHCLYKEYAERLIESGYGKVSEYETEREMLGSQIKVLKQRLNNKYVEIERLKDDYAKLQEQFAQYQMASDKEIMAQRKHAQIDVLNKLKDSYGLYYLSAFGVKERMLADILNPMIEELKK